MTPRQQFRRFRRKTGMSQATLATALGISRRAVIYIETGHNKPGMRTWYRFQNLTFEDEKNRPSELQIALVQLVKVCGQVSLQNPIVKVPVERARRSLITALKHTMEKKNA